MQIAEPVRRTAEIEDPTNLAVIHPLSNRLTPLLARLRVAPNAVSLAGMLCGTLAGYAYFRSQDARFAVAGFVLMIAWHVLDGADGQLARLTRSQSETGKVLDGICDYVTFIAVYLGLALRLGRPGHGWVWLLVALAGACHAVQSAAYEVQRQDYDAWGRGRETKRFAAPAPLRPAAGQGAIALLHGCYLRIQFLAVGFDAAFRAQMDAALSRSPEAAMAIRRRYRAVFAPPVRRWSILSANTRTIGIFLCTLLQVPLFYFVFEIAGFTLILVLLAWRQCVRKRRFLGCELQGQGSAH